MHPFKRHSVRTTAAVIVILLLVQSKVAGGYQQGQSRHADVELPGIRRQEDQDDQDENAQSLYGKGVRYGSYLQAGAFLIGFLTLPNIDLKGQFSGIILALQLLIPWWSRLRSHTISIPELWVALAQILLFTTPGAFLLFFSYSVTRRHWKTTAGEGMVRKEVIRREGWNFLQVFAILTWVNVSNFAFATVITFDNVAPNIALPDNPIWMWKVWEARSRTFKGFIWIQCAIVLVLEVIPYYLYLHAFFSYIRDVDTADKFEALSRIIRRKQHWDDDIRRRYRLLEQEYKPIEQRVEKERRKKHGRHTLLKGFWILIVFFYVGMLIYSIESTIQEAELKPVEDLLDPSQLPAFSTGIAAVISALTNFCDNKMLVETPVRYEYTLRGEIKIFTQDGKALGENELERLRGRSHPMLRP